MRNNNTVKLVFVIVLFVLLVAGGTYAWITMSANVTNGNYNASTTCFLIDYDIKNADGTSPITGTLIPSSGASGGLSGKTSMKIKSTCMVNGTGTLSLNVVSADSIFFQKVAAHCENSKNLKTMPDYKNSSTCTAQTNGKWVTNGTALKYAVYDSSNITSNSIPLSTGYITKTGDMEIYDNFALTKTATNLYVFIWLDGHVSDNSYANLAFNGYIHASAVQNDA